MFDSILNDFGVVGDFIISDSMFIFNGMVDFGDNIILIVIVDGIFYIFGIDFEFIIDGSGNWSFDLIGIVLLVGIYVVVVIVIDEVGNLVSIVS